jgi:hypothetical protein
MLFVTDGRQLEAPGAGRHQKAKIESFFNNYQFTCLSKSRKGILFAGRWASVQLRRGQTIASACCEP